MVSCDGLGSTTALRRAKLRRSRFHDLRHTLASLLIMQNVHPKPVRTTMHVYGYLMRDADNEATEKLAALVLAGSKTVATEDVGSQEDRMCLKGMEAGVGIEPASTALQSVKKVTQENPS